MRRLFVALALLAVSCAAAKPSPPVECVTSCGMNAQLSAQSCGALRKQERRIVKVLGRRVKGWSSKQVCAALRDWTVATHKRVLLDMPCEKPSWNYPLPSGPFCVDGFTHDVSHLVETTDEDWANNALAHEIVHVVDLSEHLHGHCRWEARGVFKAIEELTGEIPEVPKHELCD